MNEALRLLTDAGRSMRALQDAEASRAAALEQAFPQSGMAGGGGHGGGGSSKTERTAIKLADMDARIDRLRRQRDSLVRKTERMLSGMAVERYARLLRMRYLDEASWPTIMQALGYREIRSVYRAHRRALEAAAQTLQKEKARKLQASG